MHVPKFYTMIYYVMTRGGGGGGGGQKRGRSEFIEYLLTNLNKFAIYVDNSASKKH